jgi:hypothetical protein
MDSIRQTIIARASQLGLSAYAIAKAIHEATGTTSPDVGTVKRYLNGTVSLNSRYVSQICDVLDLELTKKKKK